MAIRSMPVREFLRLQQEYMDTFGPMVIEVVGGWPPENQPDPPPTHTYKLPSGREWTVIGGLPDWPLAEPVPDGYDVNAGGLIHARGAPDDGPAYDLDNPFAPASVAAILQNVQGSPDDPLQDVESED
ncbi:hypothetical protein [Trinickia mobilis]|uniref:hypothetical protein n=1 Tax=Trinickia mobilis TaxID=2816356 RepID=UPI001A900AAB|nr:hypothetical protein [Trinickia mobilis]